MSAGGGRILVVDDERPIRHALEVTLTKAGYAVQTATNGDEALTAAALTPPDLVILDLMLPDADGADVCRQLRDWLAAPILLISAVGEDSQQPPVRHTAGYLGLDLILNQAGRRYR